MPRSATTPSGGGGGKSGKGGGGGKPGGKGQSKSEAWAPAPLEFPEAYHGTGDHGRPHSDVVATEENGLSVIRYVLWAY